MADSLGTQRETVYSAYINGTVSATANANIAQTLVPSTSGVDLEQGDRLILVATGGGSHSPLSQFTMPADNRLRTTSAITGITSGLSVLFTTSRQHQA